MTDTDEEYQREVREKYAEYELRPLREERAKRIYDLRVKLRDTQRELNEAEATCPNCANDITIPEGAGALKCRSCGEVFPYKPLPLMEPVKPQIKIAQVKDRMVEPKIIIDPNAGAREVEKVEYKAGR